MTRIGSGSPGQLRAASRAPVSGCAAETRLPAVRRPTMEGWEEVEGPAHLEELPAQSAAGGGERAPA